MKKQTCKAIVRARRAEEKATAAKQKPPLHEEEHFQPFRICVRKRPLLAFEKERQELDVVHVHGYGNNAADKDKKGQGEAAIICHESKVHRSGRRLSVTHHQQPVHRMWGAGTDAAKVFEDEVRPLLQWAAPQPHAQTQTEKKAGCRSATMLFYGQTGTGKAKSHTLIISFLTDVFH